MSSKLIKVDFKNRTWSTVNIERPTYNQYGNMAEHERTKLTLEGTLAHELFKARKARVSE